MQVKPRVCILISVMMGCALLFDVVGACDVIGVLTCNKMIGPSVQTLGQGVLPDASTLKRVCSVLDKYTTCVDENVRGCGSRIQHMMQVVNDGVDFMCRDSYQAILNNSDCWIKPVLKSDISQCMGAYKRTTKGVSRLTPIFGANWVFRRLCKAMHGVTYCMSSAAKKRCGTEPELIMHNLMNTALRQIYKLVRGCSAPTLKRMIATNFI